MVETKRNGAYPLLYKFRSLALVLMVASAILEITFFAMNILKNRFCNRIYI